MWYALCVAGKPDPSSQMTYSTVSPLRSFFAPARLFILAATCTCGRDFLSA
jgi:hypothetical protein